MADISPESVARSAHTFGYDIQGWMCQFAERRYDGTSDTMLPFILLCIHSSPPYEIETYDLSQQFLMAGMTRFMMAMDGITAKRWRTERHGQIKNVDLPRWLHPKRDNHSNPLPIEQQVY
jgi:hypothetical protein